MRQKPRPTRQTQLNHSSQTHPQSRPSRLTQRYPIRPRFRPSRPRPTCHPSPHYQRYRLRPQRLGQVHRRYRYVILDCGPSLSLLNQNALTYADEVLIPVSCDYLALVGVKQVLRTIKDVERHLGHAVRVSAVLPTFYDGRTRLAREVFETLQGHFKQKCLEPIRMNTKLAEAPSHRKSIFEYAPQSHGAADYNRVVDWLLASSATQHQTTGDATVAA